MPKSTFKWNVEPGLAFPQLMSRYSKVIFQSGNRAAHKRASEMQQWGRANAPWTDRTGQARATLTVRVEGDEFAIGTVIAEHGVPYGLWLEIANGGRFSILTKMIDAFAPVLWRDIQRIVNLGLARGA